MIYKEMECCGLNISLNIDAVFLHNIRIEVQCVGLIRTMSRYRGGCFRDTGIYG